jgi:PAS domain-containing protein
MDVAGIDFSITRSLGRQEQQLSFAITLMEHLVVPTFVLDAEQNVLIWNRACERLTEMPAAEVLGTRPLAGLL